MVAGGDTHRVGQTQKRQLWRIGTYGVSHPERGIQRATLKEGQVTEEGGREGGREGVLCGVVHWCCLVVLVCLLVVVIDAQKKTKADHM